jgi:hypothetical protein
MARCTIGDSSRRPCSGGRHAHLHKQSESPEVRCALRDAGQCEICFVDMCGFDADQHARLRMTPDTAWSPSSEHSSIPSARSAAGAAPRCVVEMSYVASYDRRMPVLNFRTDERSERALAELMADGSSASDAIRQALVDAVRLRRREQMRIESLALMNDEADRAESRKVLSEMDELRAW